MVHPANHLSCVDVVASFLESSTPFQSEWKLGNAPIVGNKNREFSANGLRLVNEVKNLQTVLRNYNSIEDLRADHLKRVAARVYVKQHVATVP